MSGIRLVLASAVALLALASAKSLPAMAPPGAVLGIYTQNIAVKKAFFVDITAELKRQRLTLEDLVKDFAPKGEETKFEQAFKPFTDLFSLDLIGEEGLLAVYPDGSLLALARPSAAKRSAILQRLKKLLPKAKEDHGWKVQPLAIDELKDYPLLVGYRGTTLLLASPSAFRRLISEPGGLALPLKGDLVFFVNARPLSPLLQSLTSQLPKPLLQAISTPKLLASAITLNKNGIASKGRFDLDPDADAELAALFLERGEAWDLGELPLGVSAASYRFSLPKLGAYVSKLAASLGTNVDLDLSAFGDHLALITPRVETNPVRLQQQPLGDLILLVETKDAVTAEVNVLSWLQLAAASASPEGQGGFKVEKIDVQGHRGKKVHWGLGQPIYLFDLGDRLALATSEEAAKAIFGPRLGTHPGYRRYKGFWPKGAVMKSFADSRQALKESMEAFFASLPTAVEDPELNQKLEDLTRRLKAFFDYLSEKWGVSVSYSKPEGHSLISVGWSEVRW